LAAGAAKSLASGIVWFQNTADYHERPGPPRAGEVRWPDGTSRTVTVISPQEARARMEAVGGARAYCPACEQLLLTGPRLVTGHVRTSRGPATAPMWEFGVRVSVRVRTGTAPSGGPLYGLRTEPSRVKLRRLAVATPDGISVTPQRLDLASADAPFMAFYGAVADGTKLTLFPGRDGPHVCAGAKAAEVYESRYAVAVIMVPYDTCGFRGPTIEGPRGDPRITVELRTPLGDRAVLESAHVQPVPTTTG
jgi:hypothetical protein